jgi:hypothetical protein
MARYLELDEFSSALVASPRFDAVAELYQDAHRYRGLVHHGHGEMFTPVKLSSGEIDEKTRVIPLQSPQVTLGEFVLTRETIGKVQRHHIIGKMVVEADALEVLQALDEEQIGAMRKRIKKLAKADKRIYGRALF